MIRKQEDGHKGGKEGGVLLSSNRGGQSRSS